MSRLQEESPLLLGPKTPSSEHEDGEVRGCFPLRIITGTTTISRRLLFVLVVALTLTAASTIFMAGLLVYRRHHPFYSGPYRLMECQEGHELFNFYTFRNGSDSIGSDGFNTYVSLERAKKLGIVDVRRDRKGGKQYVYMMSAPPPPATTSNKNSSGRRQATASGNPFVWRGNSASTRACSCWTWRTCPPAAGSGRPFG